MREKNNILCLRNSAGDKNCTILFLQYNINFSMKPKIKENEV